MYVKRNYGFFQTVNWSKKPLLVGIVYSGAICAAFYFLDFDFSLPWQPLSVIGIAVAFYLGFKNNSSYDRTWEARKIWGSIVNNSRSFGASLKAFVQGENSDSEVKELIYRHIAWMQALTFQLRLARDWEHKEDRIKELFVNEICTQYFDNLSGVLTQYISNEEYEKLASKTNVATQLLAIQSEKLQELKDKDYYDDFRHMHLQSLITSFYEDQGKSERIKNFPFPRQYASTALWVTIVFCVILPFGMIDVFKDMNGFLFWLCPFMTGLVIWVFSLMEMIGDYSENPFEGTYNDVPISNIARGIEIDLREMINDENIPAPIKPVDGFLL